MADEDLNKPVEPVIPVQERSPEPLIVAKDDDTAPAAGGDDTLTAGAETQPAGAADDRKPLEKLPAWADKTIKDSAFEAREAKREAKRLGEENAALRKAATPIKADEEAAKAAQPSGGYATQGDFDAAVKRETQKRIDDAIAADRQTSFLQKSNDVFNKGVTEYKDDFSTAVGNLQAIGVLSDSEVSAELLGIILETDDPALVIYELGKTPDKAAALLAMTPAKRAMEIGRLAATAKKQAPRSSEAPPPVKIVEGAARVSSEPDDKDDDAAWFAKRDAQVRARMGA